jgi:hypothetical protein
MLVLLAGMFMGLLLWLNGSFITRSCGRSFDGSQGFVAPAFAGVTEGKAGVTKKRGGDGSVLSRQLFLDDAADFGEIHQVKKISFI